MPTTPRRTPTSPTPVPRGPLPLNPGRELPAEREGQRIGRYKLLQQIGEGGFGTVWMAEQTEPVTRRVALKVIKFGMDTREVIARFEAERQALAMMEHPNIAKVFDAGATEKGRPYFVMELVKGMALTEFCDLHRLDTRQRLEIFAEICSALSHAHQKGIIHRDLKPSNILITLHGDKPVPKVIDFGIAKATQSKLTEHTLFTRFEQFIGTPVYMSPEQAALSGLDIDTRSDIYSLGVLLYELLTGKPPFDARSLLSAGYDEMRRIIREQEPPKPSTRIETLLESERTGLAAAHRADVEKLGRLLRGDLDWIIMKALDKDRSRRYPTADAFALDIRRHLNDEPVEAAAPSVAYRFRKFARRNRRGLAVAATVALLLVAGVMATGWQAIRATLANRALEEQITETERERERAEANFLLARTVVDDYLVRIANDPRLNAGGLQPLRRQLLENAMVYYEKFLETGGDGPELRDATFHARFQIASIKSLIGSKDEALASYREALVLRGDSGPAERATCHYNIGFLHLDLDQYPQAESAFEESRILRERLLAEDPENPDRMAALAASFNALGITRNKSYRPQQALEPLASAISCGERLIAAHPERTDAFSDLGSCLNNLADAQRLLGQMEEAETSLGKAVDFQRAAVEREPENTQYRAFLANHYLNLGLSFDERGAPEARTMLESARRERERLVARDPTITEWQFLLARTCIELGNLPTESVEAHDAARKQLERAADILERQLEINPGWNDARSSLARARHLLALGYRSEGRGDQALEAWQDSADLSEKLVGDDPLNAATHRSNLARSLLYVGLLHSGVDQNPEATEALGRSRAAYEQLLAAGSKDPEYRSKLAFGLNSLGLIFSNDGLHEEALDAYDRAIVLLEALRGAPSPDSANEILLGGIFCNKGHLLAASPANEAALDAYTRADETLRAVLATEPENREAGFYFFNTVSGKAAVLAAGGRTAEAAEVCARAVASGPEAFRPSFRLRLAYYAALSGNAERALREVDALVGKVTFDDGAKRDLASVYAVSAAAARESDPALAASLTERALRQLALCLREGAFDRSSIEAESDFDALRIEPGYQKLFDPILP